ncbi:uncharacterized protein [Blastocystis hominis]|uniref:Uncharacterized protein n=1 Tax=Blastocystis hominis TaxID=12968 RepID=D8LYF2_BLAHO|nr:uncharacterized protein [Blastocystis hominis]CBK20607.2 unnamed protein product [Blastocystis hominis]|eukprot:XP_012894655.1 uncharacterized protein [Blastocystis hominis]
MEKNPRDKSARFPNTSLASLVTFEKSLFEYSAIPVLPPPPIIKYSVVDRIPRQCSTELFSMRIIVVSGLP